MSWLRKRRWGLAATLVVTIAIVVAQIAPRFCCCLNQNLSESFDIFFCGWPMPSVVLTVPVATLAAREAPRVDANFNNPEWHISYLVLDFAVSCLVIVATFAMCERWRRQGNQKWQLSLRTLFEFTLFCAVFITFWIQDAALDALLAKEEGYYYRALHLLPYVGTDERPWYLAVPVGFGVSCAIFWAILLAMKGIQSFWQRSVGRKTRRPGLAGSSSNHEVVS